MAKAAAEVATVGAVEGTTLMPATTTIDLEAHLVTQGIKTMRFVSHPIHSLGIC